MPGTFKKFQIRAIASSIAFATVAQAAYGTPGSSFGIPGQNATYDYVIVGGGNAGATLAARLVEQKAGSVALIEAGTFYETTNGNISTVPATGADWSGKSHQDWQPMIDWGYYTTPQAGAYNVSMHYARGKTLGGCTARNFMVYQRGTKGAYQEWADQVGDDSYTFENFLPFFQKSVNFTPPDMSLRMANATVAYNRTAAGTLEGPLSITYSHYPLSFSTWANKAFEQIGIPLIDGFLGGKLLGYSYTTSTIQADTMYRDSSETSFLQMGLEYPELTVYTLSTAKKVLFNESKTATGVVVEIDEDHLFTLSARKEIILSAGVFASPQLLMVSGVGPADLLDSLDIPVVADRPGVGQGMQDHLFSGVDFELDSLTLSSLNIPEVAAEHAVLYNNNATGLYSNTNTEVLAWEKIPERLRASWTAEVNATLSAYPEDWPEIEYITIPSYVGNQSDVETDSPRNGKNYGSLTFALITPRSRGSVVITSPDFNDAPLINPNYLTEQADVDVMVAAFKRAREFFATSSMSNQTIGVEAYPGPGVQSDAEIEDFIRVSFNAIWHATSTCKMGPLASSASVVDNRAKVIGVNSLRVVDASAFPFVPPGHPMSTIYAFAEKIACDISGNC